MDIKTKEKKYFGRADSALSIELVRSQDSFLYDADGKRYIDFVAGWCVGNFGWGNEEIKSAIRNSTSPDYVPPNLYYKPWAELAEQLAEIAPGNLQKSYRTTGGTESVDAALQMAMLYTDRHKFMSIEGSYHGNSLAAMSVASSEYRDKFRNLLTDCFKVEPPLDMDAIGKIERRLKEKDIAAFIMEPVILNLGVMIPDKEFMERLQELCRAYGTLLIMDEVATGFGRTGKLFASEHFGIEPDIMTIGKSLSGGCAGIGAVMTTKKIADAIEGKLTLYSTYGWHPLSVDAALATLRYIRKNEETLQGNVAAMSELFHERLNKMSFRHPHKINVMGLAVGTDVGDADYAQEIQKKCLEAGLLISAEGKSLAMFPALTIEKEVVEEGLGILEECL